MKNTKLNKEQICSVRTHVKLRNKWYSYDDPTTLFGFKVSNGGWHDIVTIGGKQYQTKEQIEKSGRLICDVEQMKVYFKPHVEIRMSDGSEYEKFFETESDLNEFMSSEDMKNINWIKL